MVYVVPQGSDFMSTLQELWYGNIRPNEDKVITDEEKELIEAQAFEIGFKLAVKLLTDKNTV